MTCGKTYERLRRARIVTFRHTHKRTSKRTRRTATWLCVLACLLLAPPDAGTAPTLSGDDRQARHLRLQVFDEVWEQVRARYYDPQMRGVDWPAARDTFRTQAAGAAGQDELYAVLRRMLGLLRDPHVRVFPPGEGADWRATNFVAVGMGVREVGGELVVSEVERGSAAERSGIRAGDVVLEVDGQQAERIVARRMEERPAGSPDSARHVAAARVFDGPRDTYVHVKLRDRGGRSKTVRLRRVLRTREPSAQARRLVREFGFVSFNVFTPETVASVLRALGGELKGARGLVVDLRENGGGEAEAMTDLASAFLPAGRRLGRFTDRKGRVQAEPSTRAAPLSTAARLTAFKGPVVVLTGARTASAAEVFAAALGEEGRATVVGEGTCGCVLGVSRRHVLPDGGILDVSELDYHTTRGRRLEGVGLAPDQTVTPTLRDLREGRDVALERAVRSLRARSAEGRPTRD